MSKKYIKKTAKELKEQLTNQQYKVTIENATEPPFRNEYDNHFEKGIYVDITTGEPLFLSTNKFNSGCGWPAFSKPITKEVIKEKIDGSLDTIRTEVRSNIGDAHLGHVFPDGPKETGGLRYCINSASLKFIPVDKMKEEGYGEYIKEVTNVLYNISNEKEIYLAGGCFWGTEEYISNINGVIKTIVGYANGNTERPTYEEVYNQNTGHTEAVKVIYDEAQISLSKLLELYYDVIDPVSINRQGGDTGSQYRTGIYYVEQKDEVIINQSIAELQEKYCETIAIEVKPLTNFFKAEEYHQRYLEKNPNGYCHISKDKFEKVKNLR